MSPHLGEPKPLSCIETKHCRDRQHHVGEDRKRQRAKIKPARICDRADELVKLLTVRHQPKLGCDRQQSNDPIKRKQSQQS